MLRNTFFPCAGICLLGCRCRGQGQREGQGPEYLRGPLVFQLHQLPVSAVALFLVPPAAHLRLQRVSV